MNHFRPHISPQPTFEGYYSKFDLPSGAHIALVICSVPESSTRPHMVSFTYVPSNYPEKALFQREIWVEDIEMLDQPPNTSTPESTSNSPVSFHLRIPNVGFMTVYSDNATTYEITDPEGTFTFQAQVPSDAEGTKKRTPWSRSSPNSTPEGLLINLPLPLHWHVHTLSSPCEYTLDISAEVYNDTDSRDTPPDSLAHVHQEKNWAGSFPTSHIWIQTHDPSTRTGLVLAGGSIIGTQSYLMTYHAKNPEHDVAFTPPYSMTVSAVPSVSPTLRVSTHWTNDLDAECSVTLAVSSLTRKIEIEARTKRNTFFGLSGPFADGHRLNWLGQSFCTRVDVRVLAASGFGLGHWKVLCEQHFEGASLEFGGDEYGALDKGKRENGKE